MKIIITGSRPFTDGFEIQSMLLTRAREAKGEVIEVWRRPTGGAESIAGFLCRQHADLGLIDCLMLPKTFEGVDAVHAYFEKGADHSRADGLITRAKAAGILVEINISE
jgi:hypothetical protein